MNTLTNNISLPLVSLDSLVINLLISIVLSLVLCWHFNMRSQKRFLKRDLGLVLPVICLTTLLVITVVKSSLALSLGLVGALSIVRFRTPIKEPEELAYIFLAIAIGLALGADQKLVAVIAMPVILIVISLIDWIRPALKPIDGNLLVNIEIEQEEHSYEPVIQLIQSISPEVNLRRVDQEGNNLSIHALIKVKDSDLINTLSKEFRVKYPSGRLSILDDSIIPSE